MKRRTKTLKKGGCQVKVIYLAFIMKKFFKQETVVCLSFCFVCFYVYSIWNRNFQNVLWNWRFLEGFVNKIWTAIQRQTNMFHCTSNTCIRKNSGTYLFDEVTTDEQTTSKLVVQESIVDAILRMWCWIVYTATGANLPDRRRMLAFVRLCGRIDATK